MNINTRPWQTPNYVTVELPGGATPTFSVKDTDPQTLSRMCDDFRRGVFEKANKADPRTKPLNDADKIATRADCPVCWAPAGTVCYDNGMKMGRLRDPELSTPLHLERLR